jgi:hypothetical protein
MVHKATPIALFLLIGPTAWAVDFTDQTPCSELVAAVHLNRAMDVRRGAGYIVETIKKIDQSSVAEGRQSVVARLSAEELSWMVADTAVTCQDEPTLSIKSASIASYAVMAVAGP